MLLDGTLTKRDLDIKEKELLRNSKIKCYTMFDVDMCGINGVMGKVMETLGDGPIHLSFDIDAIDPAFAPGTGTKAKGGITYREAHFICEYLASTGRLRSMDLVEINPTIDEAAVIGKDHLHGDNPMITGGKTVRLGIELVESALGKRII